MSFARNLLRLREERGWTQYELADRLGIKRARYNAWENGLAKPRLDMLIKLAGFFEVTPDFLLEQAAPAPIPSWATARDRRDIKKFIQMPEVLYFDGHEFSAEDRQKMLELMESIAWEAKRLNKEARRKAGSGGAGPGAPD
ncbi:MULTISPECIES: helix-turn-helix domain-containing protein [unclassified Paenibacillus]|uniref:helix-turn-helix domain-containing protein n=1 Tax=unclassified Paenibacillus TaxID=185978 RepID=UPI000954FAE5|nr:MULTISPECIES: helix-turn-helix domain-containing protein [unclassified Paenibacillus]ASS67979.1 helix-turn-helix transcriptional regulator [Paenibacillus sp. RUD330]SIR42333.1 DNA-binding transcriptional regulator, XRE-family HTH domain [Paenibacillus sp. RU4X]SIR52425.1 DNA-binding transcriptional regulator, XRE-family HTH domain [Paenibacillus sp. RU4T]